jgi:predicted nucleotidyltransferase
MEAQQDFKKLLELLNDRGVEHVIVGAHALAFHGAPRYTGDLIIYIRPTAENAERVMVALADFGFGSLGLSEKDFSVPDRVVQLGYPPVRIDLVTSISGVSWEEVSANMVDGEYGNVPVKYIGRAEFVRNKRAVCRKKDLADLEALGVE